MSLAHINDILFSTQAARLELLTAKKRKEEQEKRETEKKVNIRYTMSTLLLHLLTCEVSLVKYSALYEKIAELYEQNLSFLLEIKL